MTAVLEIWQISKLCFFAVWFLSLLSFYVSFCRSIFTGFETYKYEITNLSKNHRKSQKISSFYKILWNICNFIFVSFKHHIFFSISNFHCTFQPPHRNQIDFTYLTVDLNEIGSCEQQHKDSGCSSHCADIPRSITDLNLWLDVDRTHNRPLHRSHATSDHNYNTVWLASVDCLHSRPFSIATENPAN